LSKFKIRASCFEEIIQLSSKIFKKPPLEPIYKFFTEDNGARESCVFPRPISSDEPELTWSNIYIGTTAAICSIRAEFEGKVHTTKVKQYLDDL
jgi:hypothetical protein